MRVLFASILYNLLCYSPLKHVIAAPVPARNTVPTTQDKPTPRDTPRRASSRDENLDSDSISPYDSDFLSDEDHRAERPIAEPSSITANHTQTHNMALIPLPSHSQAEDAPTELSAIPAIGAAVQRVKDQQPNTSTLKPPSTAIDTVVAPFLSNNMPSASRNALTSGAAAEAQKQPQSRQPPRHPILAPEYRYCSRDGFVKPMRAHHCRICATCEWSPILKALFYQTAFP